MNRWSKPEPIVDAAAEPEANPRTAAAEPATELETAVTNL